MRRFGLLLCLALVLNACTSIETNSLQEYLALFPTDPSVQSNQRIQAFIALYDQMDSGKLDWKISETYAEKLYFNDTVVTIRERESLLKYLKHTQQELDSIKFQVLDVLDNGDDSYVRWLMQVRFNVLGKSIDAQSIGMSHLRFDADNKIILHQDYWDSTQGLYQHLPVIGGALRWIKSSLGDY